MEKKWPNPHGIFFRCACATLVPKTLFQVNHTAHILELFYKESQNICLLPKHSYQLDKIIIYVAQIQFYFFVLLSKHITKQTVRDKAFNIEPSQAKQ
jgi:hypothetical protein